MEPSQYFHNMKSSFQNAELEELTRQLEIIKKQILLAHSVGQQSFLEKLAFTHDVIVREQELIIKGYSKYLLDDDILRFIKLVTPKNSIKIIELARFPRPIPPENLLEISKAKKTSLFDDFFVVFTDFTENSYETPEERKLVERNRDPVVFGWFKSESSGYKHNRVYYVTDWQDQYCDLDFAKLVSEMSKTLNGDVVGTLLPGELNLDMSKFDKIKSDTISAMNLRNSRDLTPQIIQQGESEPSGFFKKLFMKLVGRHD